MANSWYFDEYGDQMISNYKNKLTEYQKKKMTLPHEEQDFDLILIEPKDYAEAVFAAYCFKFLTDGTDFLKELDKKLQEKNIHIQIRKKLSYRLMDVSLGWGTENIIKHYLSKLYEYHPELGIQDELKSWVKTELKRIIHSPKTEPELELCQKYLECLAEKENEAERKRQEQAAFEESIQNYLTRLENRQGVYERIKKLGQSHSALLDILWNPTTREELEFCISYFGFQDDIKFISEAAKDGNIKAIDLNATSDAVFFGDWYFEQPINQAKTLFDLTILEQSDYQGLMTILQEKGGYSTTPTAEYENFKSYLEAMIIAGISREEIAKGSTSEVLTRFNSFAQKFHQRYLANVNYEGEDTSVVRKSSSTPKSREDEVREYASKQPYQYVKTLVE